VQALLAVQPPRRDPDDRVQPGGVPVSDDVQVRARDPESGKILPHGEDGELEFRGPSQMAEYFGDPAATRKAMTSDGFLRSGDLGHTTPDGGFIFIARMGDVLRLGGFLVSPPEIESHLVRHPAVSGAQVVGAQIDGRPRAVAFVTVVLGAGFDEAALRGHCRDGLAGFKVPYRIFELDAFPTTKSANGTKIQRAKLREMADQRVRDRPTGHPA
ncbi:MAG: acyl-CoA synthetase, partial [Pseudomonadota bacterium]